MVGVAVDSLEDMETIVHGLPLEQASPSLTINGAAAIALAQYVVTAQKERLTPEQINGTTQNDIFNVYLARGAYIYPPRPALRLCTAHLKALGVREIFTPCSTLANICACIHRIVGP